MDKVIVSPKVGGPSTLHTELAHAAEYSIISPCDSQQPTYVQLVRGSSVGLQVVAEAIAYLDMIVRFREHTGIQKFL